ncbi:hypothetical protein PHET_11966, partial [Paragonimus heterotremus]
MLSWKVQRSCYERQKTNTLKRSASCARSINNCKINVLLRIKMRS